MRKCKRKKAFIGAVIGGVSSLINVGTSLYNSKKQADAAKTQAEEQARLENQRIYDENVENTRRTAQGLANNASNQIIETEYASRFGYRYGGKKSKYNNSTNRFAAAKKYKSSSK